ncbi:hypothetical protein C723_1440 [Christiangramia flava JLT2011]|uniref:Uncharacterized protein n=1 Tax=Christiangramia flava JLT2011 TaxID=1229726 RepID=A0A1L7IA43_9FLAO|nr:hypothetical protein GRFL_3329 [Christiangramia flava JLT2011]OSS39538.1 hypothetical protein C723_1440 [Christiangramia flava JLT2011]
MVTFQKKIEANGRGNHQNEEEVQQQKNEDQPNRPTIFKCQVAIAHTENAKNDIVDAKFQR